MKIKTVLTREVKKITGKGTKAASPGEITGSKKILEKENNYGY